MWHGAIDSFGRFVNYYEVNITIEKFNKLFRGFLQFIDRYLKGENIFVHDISLYQIGKKNGVDTISLSIEFLYGPYICSIGGLNCGDPDELECQSEMYRWEFLFENSTMRFLGGGCKVIQGLYQTVIRAPKGTVPNIHSVNIQYVSSLASNLIKEILGMGYSDIARIVFESDLPDISEDFSGVFSSEFDTLDAWYDGISLYNYHEKGIRMIPERCVDTGNPLGRTLEFKVIKKYGA